MTKQAVPALFFVVLSACAMNRVQTGPTTHESKAVELGKSELARVELKMGVGELNVDGGSPKLLEADFLYNVPAWKPLM
jgi:hypothetical protein